MLAQLFLLIGVLLLCWSLVQYVRRVFSSPDLDDYVELLSSDKPRSQSADSEHAKGHPLTIIYASQSGNAQNFAEELRSDAKKRGFAAQSVDIEDYEPDQLLFEELVVFLVATYGEGDPTDSAYEFMQWISTLEREEEDYSQMHFGVFGLGNRQYEFFNKQGKVLDRRLAELGAVRVVEKGLGDDDGSIEDDWESWKELLFVELSAMFADVNVGQDDPVLDVFTPSFRIVFQDQGQSIIPRFTPSRGESSVFVGHVVGNKELRINSPQHSYESTRHVTIRIPSHMTYETADNLAVMPRNDFKLVGRLCKRLGYNRKQLFRLKSLTGDKQVPISDTCSVEDALLYYCDITGSLRKKLLRLLAQFAQHADEQQQLLEISESPEKYQEMERQRFGLLDYLLKFPSIQIPLECLLELIPRLQPRYFTIASSNLPDPTLLDITVAVVDEPISPLRSFKGVCSSFLGSLPSSGPVHCFLRPSSFRLPSKPVPVIMVGPGTGIAPMRAFLQEKTSSPEGKGVFHLYFGCRWRTRDFIYRVELEEAVERKVLDKLVVACSREQQEKVYVQHKLAEDGQELWEMLESGGHVYVCGATEMGKDVRNVFMSIFQQFGGMSETDSVQYLHSLQKTHRFVQELWG